MQRVGVWFHHGPDHGPLSFYHLLLENLMRPLKTLMLLGGTLIAWNLAGLFVVGAFLTMLMPCFIVAGLLAAVGYCVAQTSGSVWLGVVFVALLLALLAMFGRGAELPRTTGTTRRYRR